ncbi:DNA polymerase III subunit gamma/tau [candidate division WWE3 bacterium]|uniref:DNA polymerase III subunit gamma/tau n=1 Tax=candidate division WWE3 bacterium TaxID=2053526 RepID=A0A955LK21_UNCKA|nr:DNA polymerase III subunit gamma/tau [candidate division WWE3 bacterium]
MSEVLYRKYRPSKLDDVVGQSHVTSLLSAALANNSVVNALLFAGPKGTGKTSVARILARELDVSGVDLIEIDAASNRGIDKIREIRETVFYQPTQSPNKLYILDEVHMLTTDAFNALLKTLEEPPNFVYFVLCTTEPYKVPVTILSRCQRYDFQPAGQDDLLLFVKSIASSEGLELDDEIARLIADNSGNSYRDAMVLLQKVIGLSNGGSVNPSNVRDHIGIVEDKLVEEVYNMIAHNNTEGFVNRVRSIAGDGVSLAYITDKIVERLIDDIYSGGPHSQEVVSSRSSLVVLLGRIIEARRRMAYTRNHLAALVSVFEVSQKTNVVDADQVLTQSAIDKKVLENNLLVTSDEKEHAQVGKEMVDDQSGVNWDTLLAKVREKKKSVETLLRAATVSNIADNEIVLAFNYAFHKEKLQETVNKVVVEDALTELYGRSYNLKCLLNEVGAETSTVWDIPQADNLKTETNGAGSNMLSDNSLPKRSGNKDDLLEIARDVFGGQLIE